MPNIMDRRSMLTGALFGGAAIVGASTFGSFAPEQAFGAEPDAVEPGMRDPNFAEGLIRDISGDTISATGSDGTLWRIRVTDGTSIWKLRPTTFDQIAVGDGLYARGARLEDGTLAADAIWANIVNLPVHVVSISDNKLHLDHVGDRIVGHVIPGQTAAVYNNTPAISDVSMVRVDSHVQILGAWLPGTNEVEIATIYAAN